MFPLLLVFGSLLMVPVQCCRKGEYETSNGACCPMCYEGAVVQRDCTVESGTRCRPCESGTFMNKANGLTKCFPCASCDPGHGLFTQSKCSPKNNTICDILTGYYCTSFTDETGCSLAERHRRCAPGQRIKEPGTKETDTVCGACPTGYFSQDGVNCTAWTICSETQVVLEGSPSKDIVCGIGSRHHYFLSLPCLLLFITVLGIVFTVLCVNC